MTSTGLPSSETSAFARGDSFDTVDEETSLNLAAVGDEARSAEGGAGMGLRRPSSSGSDNFSVGGEDGEGYWERQCDPASGMAYYLNDKVGCSFCGWSWSKVCLQTHGLALGFGSVSACDLYFVYPSTWYPTLPP